MKKVDFVMRCAKVGGNTCVTIATDGAERLLSVRTQVKEADVEAYLVERVKALGGEVRKVQWIGRRGAPDRFVMLPTVIGIWVELKAPGLAATFPATPHERQQHREHQRMRRLRQQVEVIDSFAGVDALLEAA